ncbi:OsmC family protein [Gallaecimonas mangrovi]|uniref:OsmC family protein n=1 Tax=Gallaecimonas mangrovi TaxID=2291597 RepID=UPI000E200333|nr:OsmC family protein [Gallaecimonas mangrovi]
MITLETVEAGKLRHRVQVEHFDALFADVPQALGGEGTAPDPHDYFDLSLGACKALTIFLYARHKKLPLETLTVTVSRDDSEERKGKYQLSVTLAMAGDLSDDEKAKLVDIGDKCPIHKLMTSTEVSISTALA